MDDQNDEEIQAQRRRHHSDRHLDELARQAERAYSDIFDGDPSVVVAAPGRVNLIGEHIDYNDGFVLPMAIERYVVIAATKSDAVNATAARVHSVDLDETIEVPLSGSTEPTLSGWASYIEGVVAGFAERGAPSPPFNAVIVSSVPQGGGLSSSAAIEVATATLLESLTNCQLTPVEKALLCQRAEHLFAGVPCGIMDQFSSVMGQPNQLMLIDCLSKGCQLVPFDSSDVSVLITNSNVKHELTGGEYANRRSDCDQALAKIGKQSWRDVALADIDAASDSLSSTEFRRARHVVTEIARTVQAQTAFQQSDWRRLGELMYASHDSLRHDFEVSCDELDLLVEVVANMKPHDGVIGSRMTGGGFGGCTVSLVRNQKIDSVIESLKSAYKNVTGFECECFSSRPARGAHVLP